MREMLEPIFGSGGAIIAQFIITLAVVLALVGVVVWLVRRYAAGGLGTTVRGRLPRLAVIDALAVDNRRRLVLVRRDNVEHLLLIGGPADVVVEPGIARARAVSQRQAPAARPQPASGDAAEAGAAPAENAGTPAPAPARQEPAAVERPIPFPPRRTERAVARRDPRPVVSGREDGEGSTWQNLRSVLGGSREETRVTPFVVPNGAAPEVDVEQEAEAAPPAPSMAEPAPEEPAPAESAEPTDAPVWENRGDADDVELPSFLAPAAPASESVAPTEPPPLDAEAGDPTPDTATRVNDLEREMARLLGEISTRRSS